MKAIFFVPKNLSRSFCFYLKIFRGEGVDTYFFVHTVFLSAVLFLTGCADDNLSAANSYGYNSCAEIKMPDPVEGFTIVCDGVHGISDNKDKKIEVVRDRASFERAFLEAMPDASQPFPEVDFDKFLVLVFAGGRAGVDNTLTVTSVSEIDIFKFNQRVEVAVEYGNPCVSQDAEGYSYSFVAIPLKNVVVEGGVFLPPLLINESMIIEDCSPHH